VGGLLFLRPLLALLTMLFTRSKAGSRFLKYGKESPSFLYYSRLHFGLGILVFRYIDVTGSARPAIALGWMLFPCSDVEFFERLRLRLFTWLKRNVEFSESANLSEFLRKLNDIEFESNQAWKGNQLQHLSARKVAVFLSLIIFFFGWISFQFWSEKGWAYSMFSFDQKVIALVDRKIEEGMHSSSDKRETHSGVVDLVVRNRDFQKKVKEELVQMSKLQHGLTTKIEALEKWRPSLETLLRDIQSKILKASIENDLNQIKNDLQKIFEKLNGANRLFDAQSDDGDSILQTLIRIEEKIKELEQKNSAIPSEASNVYDSKTSVVDVHAVYAGVDPHWRDYD
jgi:hypothetical protein